MQSLMLLLTRALPVFVMLLLGMLCRRRQLISREGIGALKRLVVDITLPAVMFSAFATAEYSASSLVTPLLIFIACVLMLMLGKVCCRAFRIPGRLSPFLASGFEAGMLGYALFALLFQEVSASCFATIDLGQVLFVFTVYKAMLAGRGGLRSAVMEALHAPVVWGIAAGLAMGATGLYTVMKPSGISGVLDAVADFVAAPTSAVILLTIGYDMDLGQIRWRVTARLAALRLGVCAVALGAVLLLDHLLLNGMMHTGALVLMFTLPPPYVLPVFADVEEERADISSALSVLTLISLILFALLNVLFQ